MAQKEHIQITKIKSDVQHIFNVFSLTNLKLKTQCVRHSNNLKVILYGIPSLRQVGFCNVEVGIHGDLMGPAEIG